MQMHGAVKGKPARRALRVVVVSVLTTGLLALASGPALAKQAGAKKKPPRITAHTAIHEGSSYLALGDSVTFGYEEPSVKPAPNYHDASSLIGYPEMFGAELHVNVVNPSCPGETSASLIDATAPSNGCENGYRAAFPLHVSYSGSQLDFAVNYLRTNHDVRLVSLMIGANDFFLCQKATTDQCTSSGELAALSASVGKNVTTILSAIRFRAHYRGQIAIVNYYSLDYSNPLDNLVTEQVLNANQDNAAAPFHVEIADGFGELQAGAAHSGGSTCNAGLLTQLGAPGTCGIHPSYAGQSLLAQSLAKVVFVSEPFRPFW
jgi:lysophospholipase L1-like esterase